MNNKMKTFYNEESIIIKSLDYISNELEGDKIEFYIHNINFDGYIILECLTLNSIKFDFTSVKSNLFWLKFKYKGKEIFLRCSYKIIGLPLWKIGENEGICKGLFPHSFVTKDTLEYVGDLPEKKFWADEIQKKHQGVWSLRKECIYYCELDVKILCISMSKLLGIISNESKTILYRCFSTPSIAHTLFFTKYNTNRVEKKIPLKHSNYIRDSYYGGRCEVFGNIYEGEHIKYYDFSGMYGQCMLENFHVGKGEFAVPKDFSKPGFYTIKYYSKDFWIPLLPTRFEDRLMFKNGCGEGCYWYEEIIYFIENGGVVQEIMHALIYQKTDKVFNKFVEKFTNIREKGGYYKTFGKLMINSLYGSLGLSEKESYTYVTQFENEYRKMLEEYKVINSYKRNSFYILVIEIDSKFRKSFGLNTILSKRNVSMASAIASKARIKLAKLFTEVEKDGGRLLYCDTDSAFAAYPISDVRSHFGERKWIEFYKEGVFALPKTYGLVDYNSVEEIKLKGFYSKNIRYVELKENFYREKELMIENQEIISRSTFRISQKTIKKKLSFSNYRKRIFTKDKKNTIPKK